MRWCKVFPGQEDQIPCVRTFVSQLLADHPDRADIVTCAAELAANAVRHTASGRDGFFATEVTWTGLTVRVAVADGGAGTAPPLGPDRTGPDLSGPDLSAPDLSGPRADSGLGRLAQLASRCGTEGDDHGRVVWAQFLQTTGSAPGATSMPLAAGHSTAAEAADLAERYQGWHTWFGHWTRQWWAIPKQASRATALIAEPTAGALAQRLDSLAAAP
jgi:serine/threonine-protein kinase RsbW